MLSSVFMRQYTRFWAVALFTLCPLMLAEAAKTRQDVHEFKLDNGLEIIIKQDHRAPVVVSQIWYKVGSSYEYSGITGISHMLEHMMFKGTHTLGPGEFSRILAAEGGSENAFTARDYTAYFQHLASDRLEVAFRLEADRMTGLKLDQNEFLKERDVVAEERRLRTDDKPTALTYEQFMATTYQTSPYHHPVIGWMADINNYRLEDLDRWYRRWYRPNNAVLVVAGDVDPAKVREMAQRHFGPLPPGEIRPPKPRPEIKQVGIRSLKVKAPAKLPYLVMGYKAPSLSTAGEDWEPYALAVLAAVLDGDDSARFSRHLVRGGEIAAQAGADYNLYSGLSTLFLVDGVPAKGRGIAELETALREQIERVRKEPASEKELNRIKTQVVAEDIFQRDSLFYQAMRIGMLETIGMDWRVDEDYVARIQAVTAEQVRQVARKYLVDDGLTVAVLEPRPLAEDRSASGNKGVRHGR